MDMIYHLDDDPLFLDQVKDIVAKSPLAARLKSFYDLAEFLESLNQSSEPAIILLDIYLDRPDTDGRTLVKQMRARFPRSFLIMCSDMQDISTVRECMARGADDFLFKGQDDKKLLERLLHADAEYARRRQQQNQTQKLQDLPNLAGRTAKDLCERIPRLLDSALSAIHVFGETGTGKEIVADIFAHLIGRNAPFLRVHCGAIPSALIESELFGHVKGAFTGAVSSKIGLFEKADGGWVFLDEVATLSPAAQISLLRVLENQELRPVGATASKRINVRVLSATNESLEELVDEGRFRRDLWQRLCEATIVLPPLRERMDEIEELVPFFCQTMRGGPYQISTAALEVLKQYPWQHGNIRELRNCLRAMTEHAYGGIISPSAIPKYIWTHAEPKHQVQVSSDHIALPLQKPLQYEQLKNQLLVALIRHCHAEMGYMTLRQLAKTLDIPRSTLSNKLRSLVKDAWIGSEELRIMVNTQAEGKG